MKRFIIPLFVVILASIVMVGFTGQDQLPDVHDPTIAYRTQLTIDTVRDGQFPAAWHNTLNYGYGYPLNLYYAPLLTYITAILSMFIGSVAVAVKTSLWLITIVGVTGVYVGLKKYGVIVAVVSATAFAMLPYHASALYVRGSYAEYLAINLLPWVIYAWTRPFQIKKDVASASIIMALFLLAHNTITYLALPIIIGASVISQPHNYKKILIAIVLSLALPAIFTFPSLFERNYIQVDSIATKTNITDHFVYPDQLWYSPWGYGGSSVGKGDLMSYMLGKGQVILAIVGIVVALILRDKIILIKTIPLIMMTVAALPISHYFWTLIPSLSIIQFPWRVLGIATLGLAYASGYSLSFLKSSSKYIIGFVIIIALVWTNYHYFKPWNMHSFNYDILSSASNLYPLVSHKIPEYLPSWMPTFPTIEASDGLTRSSTRVTGQLDNKLEQTLTIQTAYMPHWKLTLNGYSTDIVPNESGTIRTHAPVPPGTYDVELTWHKTPIEKLGVVLSLVALIVVLGLAL